MTYLYLIKVLLRWSLLLLLMCLIKSYPSLYSTQVGKVPKTSLAYLSDLSLDGCFFRPISVSYQDYSKFSLRIRVSFSFVFTADRCYSDVKDSFKQTDGLN